MKGPMRPRPGLWFLDRWTGSVAPAVAIQERVGGAVRVGGRFRASDAPLAAGIDVGFSRDGRRAYCAAVVVDLRTMETADSAGACEETRFPYIPGFLSFREGPVVLQALSRLRVVPDVLLFDGQGLAHPRRCGLASHVGACLDVPSVGCAKSRLVGEGREPGLRRGSWSALSMRGERVGMALRTREGVRPLFVSVGHLVTLADARRVVLRAAPRFRIPEPLRRAHAMAAGLRDAEIEGARSGSEDGRDGG